MAKFNVNDKRVRNAIALQLSGGQAAAVNGIEAVRALIGMMQKKHMVIDDADAYAWALAKARSERDSADLKMRVPVVEPSRSNISELKGVLRMHKLPFVDAFLDECVALAVSLAFLKRLAAWVRSDYATANKGPTRDAIIEQLRIFRGLKNAGRSGKRSASRRKTGQGRKPDPVARLDGIIEACTEFKRTFGDENGFVARALQSLKSAKPYAVKVKKAQEIKKEVPAK